MKIEDILRRLSNEEIYLIFGDLDTDDHEEKINKIFFSFGQLEILQEISNYCIRRRLEYSKIKKRLDIVKNKEQFTKLKEKYKRIDEINGMLLNFYLVNWEEEREK